MGRPQKREYKTTFRFPFRYDKNLTPPLTPAMNLLGFMFKEKAIGGRVGKPVKLIEENLIGVEVTEANKNITLDALLSDEFLALEKKKLGGHTGVELSLPKVKDIQRNEIAYFNYNDNYKEIEPIMHYSESLHKILPLLESRKTRSICVENLKNDPKATKIYKLWNDRAFDIEVYDEDTFEEAVESISREKRIDKAVCSDMLCLAQNYKTFTRITPDDYNITIEYFKYIHKIMYLLSTSTIKLIDDEATENNNITLNFFEPNYERLIKNEAYFQNEVAVCNKWLLNKLGLSRRRTNNFRIYANSKNIYGIIPSASIPDKQEENRVEYILKKLLMLVLSVYQSDLIEEFMSVGKYYISVCNYCGGLFFRDSTNKIYCDYYKGEGETPCNNMKK